MTAPNGGGRRVRRNGEGNIRQRKDGRFEARVWVFTTDGRGSARASTARPGMRRMRRWSSSSLMRLRVSAFRQRVRLSVIS